MKFASVDKFFSRLLFFVWSGNIN